MSAETNRAAAVRMAKRQIIDVLWKTANIEIDGITFPDTQEIFEGRAPAGMGVDDVIAVNNIKHAWRFLFDNVDHPVDWPYVSEYNRLVGEGLVAGAGALRSFDVRVGGTRWIPDLPDIESSRDRIGEFQHADISAEERAIGMFCAITRGQWFPDGNKRTALMVANHVLVNAGVGVFAIAPESKKEFTTLLLGYYESNDAAGLAAWLSDNAVERLPGGLTDAERRNLRTGEYGEDTTLPRLTILTCCVSIVVHENTRSSSAGLSIRRPLSTRIPDRAGTSGQEKTADA